MIHEQQTYTITANVLEGILADRLQIPAWEYEYMTVGWAAGEMEDWFLDECWMMEMASLYLNRDEKLQSIPFEGERFYNLVSETFEKF
jgi:hypothetical protein